MVVTYSRPQEEEEDGINVFIRTVDGKTRCLWVNDPYTQSVAMTKKRLLDSSSSSCRHFYSCGKDDDFLLTWNGKPLEEERCLAHYGVLQNGMTLHASHRLKGGCFMVSFTILFVILLSLVGSFCTCGLSLVVVPFLMPLLFVLPLFCL